MPTFTAPNEDVVLSFSLIVNDGEYNSTSDQVDITVVVINTPPELVIDENYEMDK